MWPKQSWGASSEKCTEEGDVEIVHYGRTGNEKRQEENEKGSRNELHFQDQSSRMPLKKILIIYLGIGEETRPKFCFSLRTVPG